MEDTTHPQQQAPSASRLTTSSARPLQAQAPSTSHPVQQSASSQAQAHAQVSSSSASPTRPPQQAAQAPSASHPTTNPTPRPPADKVQSTGSTLAQAPSSGSRPTTSSAAQPEHRARVLSSANPTRPSQKAAQAPLASLPTSDDASEPQAHGPAPADLENSWTTGVSAPAQLQAPRRAAATTTTVRDVDPAKFEALKEKFEASLSGGTSTLAERQSAIYSVAEEAAHLLGLSEYSNELIVVGMQSSGKSSIYEALTRLPLSFTRIGTATMCPVIYRIRRNASLREPVCSIRWRDLDESDLAIGALNQKLRSIMNELREIDTESEVVVEIEDPMVLTLTLIDLPGLIAPEEVEVGEGAHKKIVRKEAVDKLVDKYLRTPPAAGDQGGRGPVRRILWVKRSILDASDDAVDKTLFAQVDPSFDRTIVAATMADRLQQQAKSSQDLGLRLEQSWVDKPNPVMQPFFIALHDIPWEEKARDSYQTSRSKIANQLETLEKQSLAFLRQQAPEILHTYGPRWGWSQFQIHLQGQVNRDFMDNAKLLFRKLLQVATHLDAESKRLASRADIRLAKSDGVAVVNEFIYQFKTRLGLLLEQEGLGQDFLDRFGKTLAEEDAEAAHYLAIHNTEPIPDDTGDASRRFREGVANAERRAITMARAFRVNAENAQRMATIMPSDFTEDQLLAAIPAAGDIDLLHPPWALQLLLVEALTKHVLPFVSYAVWRMAYCMVDCFDPVIELLRQQGEYRPVTENKNFVESLREAFYQWVETRAGRCEKLLQRQARSLWAFTSWNLPTYVSPELLGRNDGGVPLMMAHPVVPEGSRLKGLLADVGGKVCNLPNLPATLDVSSTDAMPRLKEILNLQFEAHKMLILILIKHITMAEIMRAADPKKDRDDPPKYRLEVFLRERLISQHAGDDPYGITEEAKKLGTKAQLLGRQAAGIRELHKALSEQLESLQPQADMLSLHLEPSRQSDHQGL